MSTSRGWVTKFLDTYMSNPKPYHVNGVGSCAISSVSPLPCGERVRGEREGAGAGAGAGVGRVCEHANLRTFMVQVRDFEGERSPPAMMAPRTGLRAPRSELSSLISKAMSEAPCASSFSSPRNGKINTRKGKMASVATYYAPVATAKDAVERDSGTKSEQDPPARSDRRKFSVTDVRQQRVND